MRLEVDAEEIVDSVIADLEAVADQVVAQVSEIVVNAELRKCQQGIVRRDFFNKSIDGHREKNGKSYHFSPARLAQSDFPVRDGRLWYPGQVTKLCL